MEKSQTPAIVLIIALGLIAIIALGIVVVRGIGGYGKALKRFENPEGSWPSEKEPAPEMPGPVGPRAPAAPPASR